VKLLGVIKLNPLYHVIRLMRSLLMDGVSPNLRTYAVCFVICFIPFVIGAWVFKRKQDRFILYI
ncbi:MAG: ABC transporter permease, partial [Clostridia bacterium]